jgi:hypothetical protein
VEGAGHINAFDPRTGAFLGQLTHPDGTPIAIPGLWDLSFGGGTKSNGKTNQLFFTAGPNANTFTGNGLFGMIQAVGDGGANSASAGALALRAAGQGNASAPGGAVLGGQQTQPATLPTSGPALALSAAPIQPASAPEWLTAHRVLDQVFTDLDDRALADALRRDRSLAGTV